MMNWLWGMLGRDDDQLSGMVGALGHLGSSVS